MDEEGGSTEGDGELTSGWTVGKTLDRVKEVATVAGVTGSSIVAEFGGTRSAVLVSEFDAGTCDDE